MNKQHRRGNAHVPSVVRYHLISAIMFSFQVHRFHNDVACSALFSEKYSVNPISTGFNEFEKTDDWFD